MRFSSTDVCSHAPLRVSVPGLWLLVKHSQHATFLWVLKLSSLFAAFLKSRNSSPGAEIGEDVIKAQNIIEEKEIEN